jgi:acyl-lipid omega-6 desaturase (Delta-12 desaturase)
MNFQVKTREVLSHFFEDALLFCLALAIWSFDLSAWLISPLVAVFMFRKFSLMHEAVHGILLQNRFFNDILGTVSGFFCLLPYETWKRSHLQHHRWSGNIEKDPVMAFLIVFPKMSTWLQKTLSYSWRLWLPILAVVQNIVFWSLGVAQLRREPRSFTLLFSLLFPLVSWGFTLALLPHELIFYALLPGTCFYLVAVEVVNLPHHLQLPYLKSENHYPAWEQNKTARSCLYPRWLARFVVLNFNYHVEHHMFPDAPWYYLENIHQGIRNELGTEYNSDLSFAWILRNKNLNLEQVLFSPDQPATKAA